MNYVVYLKGRFIVGHVDKTIPMSVLCHSHAIYSENAYRFCIFILPLNLGNNIHF